MENYRDQRYKADDRLRKNNWRMQEVSCIVDDLGRIVNDYGLEVPLERVLHPRFLAKAIDSKIINANFLSDEPAQDQDIEESELPYFLKQMTKRINSSNSKGSLTLRERLNYRRALEVYSEKYSNDPRISILLEGAKTEVYRSCFKNWEFDKETFKISCSERATIARGARREREQEF